MPITASLVLGGASVLKGTYDSIKAGSERKRALKQYQENPYTTPQSQIQAVNKAATLAQGSKMAGQDIMESNLSAKVGEGIGAIKRTAQSPSQALASTVDLYRQQMQQQNQLDLQSAGDYRVRQQGYINALTTLAPYQDKAFQYNQAFPVQARLNYAGGLQAAGQQEIASGISGIVNTYANQQYLKGFGGQTPPTVTGSAPQAQQAPFDYWGGGIPDTSIQQRQGNY